MNFRYNGKITQPEKKRFSIDNFRGVDFASSKINADKTRATDTRNLIHKNGVNHKRNGWNELCQFVDSSGNPLQINGFWNWVDSYDEDITIVHAGTKIYRVSNFGDVTSPNVTYTDVTASSTYKPSYVSLLSTWTNKISAGVLDQRSYGVIKGDRLYLFAGSMYLVYGTWDAGTSYELRAVEDNSDTYVPTTTIGIAANGNSALSGIEQSHDEVNMLCRKRRNKLIGESATSELHTLDFEDYINNAFFEGNTEYQSTYNKGYEMVSQVIPNADGIKITLTVGETILTDVLPLTVGTTLDYYDETTWLYAFDNDSVFESDFSSWFTHVDWYIMYNSSNELTVKMYWGATNNNVIIKTEIVRNLVYQLDTTGIDTGTNVDIWVDGVYIDYIGHGDLADSIIDRTTGELTFLGVNYPPALTGQSNIIVEFSKTISGEADKINKCTFGQMFGYNEVENLFVSGNPDYVNYDYHSTYPDASESQSGIPQELDLTYFGNLGYAILGSIQSKIMGYTLLDDGTLAIHKEANKLDPTIYLRTAELTDVIDIDGEVVYDIYGNAYQKIIYPQYAGSIGEGMLTRFGSGNLAGDNLFLSRNGVFGIVLNQNIKSNERFAKERSRLVNGELLEEEDLEEACAYVFDNKYFLSVNDKCYIADGRFKNQLSSEMLDTFSYEWWVWDNFPARIMFVFDDKLCFGSADGRLCELLDTTFEDTTYEIISAGGLSFDVPTNTFTISSDYDDILEELHEGTPLTLRGLDLMELLPPVNVTSGVATTVNSFYDNGIDAFFSVYRYLENKIVFGMTQFSFNGDFAGGTTGWLASVDSSIQWDGLPENRFMWITLLVDNVGLIFGADNSTTIAAGTYMVKMTFAVPTGTKASYVSIKVKTADDGTTFIDELSDNWTYITTESLLDFYTVVGYGVVSESSSVSIVVEAVDDNDSRYIIVDYINIYEVTATGDVFQLKNFDMENQTFEIWEDSDSDGVFELASGITDPYFGLLRAINGAEVHVINLDEDTGTFQISWLYDEAPTVVDGDVSSAYLPIEVIPVVIADIPNMFGYFKIKTPVVSYWETPIFSLGTAEYSKILHSITLVPEAMVGGLLEFGFRTRAMPEITDDVNLFEIEGVNLFDFNSIDFTRFTFETSIFAKSFTRKLKVKGFNFISFYIRSTNNKDSVVNSLSITYSIYRLNKGVK